MYCWCTCVCSYCVCVCAGGGLCRFDSCCTGDFLRAARTQTHAHTRTYFLSLLAQPSSSLLESAALENTHTHTSRAKLASCLPMRGGERLRLTDACTRTLHTHTNTLTHTRTLTRTHRLAAKRWRLLRWRQQLSAAFSSSSTCFWFD